MGLPPINFDEEAIPNNSSFKGNRGYTGIFNTSLDKWKTELTEFEKLFIFKKLNTFQENHKFESRQLKKVLINYLEEFERGFTE